VCNRQFRQHYPPSLIKSVLEDYGVIHNVVIQWGCDNEGDAISSYKSKSHSECGIFLSTDYPYLSTSPDGIIPLSASSFGLIEVKCPFKHKNSKIAEACVDSSFCLAYVNDGFQLKRTHNYYYQVTGQLALTGAQFCDFIVWTEVDMHIERIHLDKELWEDVKEAHPLLSYLFRNRNFRAFK